ncbi:cupin domain-containing protein [Caulobacter sp. SSI4214]|uniref:cupin domain-containing protein n=1 Tax=Caulobacter sp. SSI4214 TaxID=2575739 RepID=UPI00143C7F3C|nr:cupin domain-containing protein [Caulobacter sp. SSI4214]
MSRRLAITTIGLLLLAGAASAQERQLRLTPSEIAALNAGGATAGTSGVTGIRTTVLYGDPTKAGPYTIALRVPPNMRIAAHSHRDERTAVVVSGVWRFGYGRKADAALVKTLPPGSFYSEPAGVDHFAMTGPEGASVYISGFGPTSTDYVEASDAPKP